MWISGTTSAPERTDWPHSSLHHWPRQIQPHPWSLTPSASGPPPNSMMRDAGRAMLFPATSGPYSLWPAAGSQRLLVSLRVAAAAVCAVCCTCVWRSLHSQELLSLQVQIGREGVSSFRYDGQGWYGSGVLGVWTMEGTVCVYYCVCLLLVFWVRE